ncbi:MAG: endo-1,4-beta-xylanase, partial [Planctomycetes bacterium]|nr:endo-1,4-beta-xylanase [Planctomycetota bacterium]
MKIKKTIKILLITIVIVTGALYLSSRGYIYEKDDLRYGLTFSKKQAENLGLDWRAVYLGILSDLQVRDLRLAAYWNEVEPEKNKYAWDDLDWQVENAKAHKAEVILAVGGRLPRWPECHFPDWAAKLTVAEREQEILEYIRETVLRYHGEENIVAWQVENEPFLSHFGACPEFKAAFLDKEIALVRSLDDRPVVITDSGEISVWIPAARRADIFGTTMYRDTYSQVLKRYVHYPIGPGFFRFKKNLASLFARPDRWIVIELQAEPWGPVPYQTMLKEERDRTMNLEKFR